MRKIKPVFINLLVGFFSLLISLVVAEFALRFLVFNESLDLGSLRFAGFYADYYADNDYWKLNHIFSKDNRSKTKPHPVLGWTGRFDRDTYKHNMADSVKDRRPVLLYGDSFAGCTSGVLCFQDILNNDTSFSKNHFLLNYGVGGYGLDQIHLLFKNSIDLYDDPFVVISLMTFDLDRSVLKVRSGQKPYYILNNDSLKLQGVPIDDDPDKYIENNPPEINSYLYRRLIYSKLLPDSWRFSLTNQAEKIQMKKSINEAILLDFVDQLRKRKLDFTFLVFHPHNPDNDSYLNKKEDTWRDEFLKEFFEQQEVPYIWSKDLYFRSVDTANLAMDEYIIPKDGHPTTYFNKLISQSIQVAINN